MRIKICLKIGQFILVKILCTTYVVAISNDVGYTDVHVRQKRQTSNTAPSFAQQEYRASVYENQAPGLSVILITATDPDHEENGKLTYSITAIRDSRSNDMFTINPISGKVTTTEQLDREEIPRHDFRVTATDNNPLLKKSAFATLIINVEDENDHTPTFDQATYKVEEEENIPVGTTITTVRAIDIDTGKNQDIRYSIIEPSKPTMFQIDPRSGSISTLKVLDREVQANYELVVMTKDQADFGKQRSSTATIEIKVLDENDNFPQFSQRSYTVNVTENLDISSRPVIAHVSATDADEGRNQEISYSITGGNIDDTFYIDPTTGEVAVQKPLDYEVNKDYNLKIKAADNGNPPRTNNTNLWVRIEDLSDTSFNHTSPYFQREKYTVDVIEDLPVGSAILIVHALDPLRQTTKLDYSITGDSFLLPFAVEPHQGKIFLRTALDWEIQNHYVFTLKVTEHDFPAVSATTSVEVIVNDVNDNSPIFRNIWNVSISEDAPQNTEVVQVSATDADSKINAQITYNIIGGNTDQIFSIGSRTGIISLERDLHNVIQKMFILVITATDGMFVVATHVSIHVTGTNIHAPLFQSKRYRFNVTENAAIGTKVGVIQAIDNDAGVNGKITYELLTWTQAFGIDNSTGEIRTILILDREAVSAYSFEVRAFDNGANRRQSTAGVTVTVEDVNDNPPHFMKPVYEALIRKPVISGERIITVHATDVDFGINSQVRYQLSSGSNTINNFEIDSLNGAIYVARSNKIDTESVLNYTLTVVATDLGVPQLSTTTEVRIKVEETVIPVG